MPSNRTGSRPSKVRLRSRKASTIARANRAAAIQEYRRLTAVGPNYRSSAVLEPRYILELARLLDQQGDDVGARAEYERFLKLWANADAALPELSEAKRALEAAR